MIRKLWCRLFGHKRGKRLGLPVNNVQTYYCSRCRAEWTRKVKK